MRLVFLGLIIGAFVAGGAGMPPDEGVVELAQRIFLLVLLSHGSP